MRKTKIVCTLGPATDRDGVLREMILAGMDVARFNFSHGTHAEQQKRLEMLRANREDLGLPVAALLDTKGPEIRLGDFKDGAATLKTGQVFVLTPRDVLGDETVAAITFKNLYADVSVGSRILLDDGKIEMVVSEIRGQDIICKVLNGGAISNHKGINAPGVHLSMPYLSSQDRADILFGIEQGFDIIAASFTRNAQDINDIRQLLVENGAPDIKIIAKIENQEGVSNIDEILTASNGIMIARGDMGVEIDFTEIPIIQKKLIERCYNSGRPAITATQMLESMMTNPRPTRAEITDVANAIYDGTSAIMLSGETAAGSYPVEAVRTMAAIAERTESDINYPELFRLRISHDARLSITESVAHASCTTAMDTGADAIITVTASGETARMLCKYRPSTPIIACVMSEQIARQLNLSWGITPITMPYANNTDEMIDYSVAAALKAGLVREGDLVVITAGVPVGVSGTTNMMKAHLIGDVLASGVGISRHNVTGHIRVCLDAADLKNKFKPGDVLVTASTGNQMLEAMREAAAIITEEGGMNSHAAIVGLTLDKPVIVGVHGATQLKDGQLVSVDSRRGVIRAMPDDI
ncbi:pyruvate kinase [Ruminococcaceae bacterium OttesenSCG-928-D13]|nr:pyruvate kinase [Ruminococcaceae bacterium OttesenSCG-928-D13]